MKVYTTKYALTQGIEEVDVDSFKDSGYVYTQDKYRVQYRMGHTAFESRAAAEAKAASMRDRKIESLKKQISKLKKMTFEVRS